MYNYLQIIPLRLLLPTDPAKSRIDRTYDENILELTSASPFMETLEFPRIALSAKSL